MIIPRRSVREKAGELSAMPDRVLAQKRTLFQAGPAPFFRRQELASLHTSSPQVGTVPVTVLSVGSSEKDLRIYKTVAVDVCGTAIG